MKGQTQQRRPRKLTEYGTQLVEKQKTRNAYGLREAQFRRYFSQAAKFRGKTGEMLLQTLERRIDNVLFRAGLTRSRAQARQLINHRHFTLNGRRVSIPSTLVNVKDVIAPHKSYEAPEETQPIADWLKVDKKGNKVTVERLPEGADLPLEFDTQKIIEFYSR